MFFPDIPDISDISDFPDISGISDTSDIPVHLFVQLLGGKILDALHLPLHLAKHVLLKGSQVRGFKITAANIGTILVLYFSLLKCKDHKLGGRERCHGSV